MVFKSHLTNVYLTAKQLNKNSLDG